MMITLQCGRIKQTLLTEEHTGKSVQYSFYCRTKRSENLRFSEEKGAVSI